MQFIIYKSHGNWRWRLVAANGKIIATSGEGYINRRDCISAIELVQYWAGVSEIKEKGKGK